MAQRPTIQKPTPLTAPAKRPAAPGTDPIMGGGDVIMGASIPQFSKEMQAEISPEAAPLWNFVCNHAPKIAAAVVSIVVICLAVAGWQWYVEKELAEARGQLAARNGALLCHQKRGDLLSSFLCSHKRPRQIA